MASESTAATPIGGFAGRPSILRDSTVSAPDFGEAYIAHPMQATVSTADFGAAVVIDCARTRLGAGASALGLAAGD